MGHQSTRCLLALTFLALSAPMFASAATCNAHEFYCVTDNVFQWCLDGSSTTNSQPQVCPKDTACKPDCTEPCFPTAIPCVQCERGNKFYCVNNSSFRLCATANSNIPSPEVYNCGKNQVCSKYCKFQCMPEACPPVTCNTTELQPNEDNPKNYFLCQVVDGKVVVQEFECPGKSTFSPTLLECTGDEGAPTTTTTQRPPFDCPGGGRYPDPLSDTAYIVCLVNKTSGGYTPYYFTCPEGSIFNPATLKCTSRAVTSTTCSAEGRFPDPNSCTDFIQCSEGATAGEWVTAHYSCPSSSFFDPVSTRCTMTRPSSCGRATRGFLDEDSPLLCDRKGRIPDLDSASRYYLCVEDESEGEYIMYSLPCPEGSCFNPETNKCTYNKSVCDA